MRTLALAALVVPAVTVAAQQPARITLAARSAALPHGFTNVSSVRELPDGRVLVVDMRERSVYVADFGTKAVTAIGRQGQGPLEYARPLHLVPLPNGNTQVQNPRFVRDPP